MPGIIESTNSAFTKFVLNAWTLQGLLSGTEQPPSFQEVFDQLKGFVSSFAFSLLPIALVGMIVYGGIMRVMAGDNPQNVAKANNVITFAIIGAIVLMLVILMINLISSLAGSNTPRF